MLVSTTWTCKIADFGTARLAALTAGTKAEFTDPLLTRNVGTLLWTAPEILQERAYDRAVDVYSFGIVLWEIWTRALPFADLKTIWAIRAAVVGGTRPPVPADAPVAYVALMTQCWQPEPAARPTFAACSVALDAVPAGHNYL